jgi:hypothetical protein
MQQGSLIRSCRRRGPDVWQFRWADRGFCGKRIYRKRVIGTVCQYPDTDSARKAVTGLFREISSNPLQRNSLPVTIAELCDHFIQRELASDNTWRSYSTKKGYKAYLKRWIIPHWGTAPLSEVRTMGVVMAAAAAACEEQLRENQRTTFGPFQPCLLLRTLRS